MRVASTILLLAFALPLASAAEETTIRLFAHDEGHDVAWFEVEGVEGRNPEIALVAGSRVTFVLENRGSVEHNLHLPDPPGGVTRLVAPGETRTITVDVPANATGRALYWCDPHRQIGMSGDIVFRAPPPTPAPSSDPTPSASPSASTPAEPSRVPSPSVISIFAVVIAFALGATLKGRRRHG